MGERYTAPLFLAGNILTKSRRSKGSDETKHSRARPLRRGSAPIWAVSHKLPANERQSWNRAARAFRHGLGDRHGRCLPETLRRQMGIVYSLQAISPGETAEVYEITRSNGHVTFQRTNVILGFIDNRKWS